MSVLLMQGFYGFLVAILDEKSRCDGDRDGKPVLHKVVDNASRIR
jgi:hypothetical protein